MKLNIFFRAFRKSIGYDFGNSFSLPLVCAFDVDKKPYDKRHIYAIGCGTFGFGGIFNSNFRSEAAL